MALIAVALGLWTSWSRFPSVWTDDRNNGYAIAALSLFVLWRDRSWLRQHGRVPPWALPLVAVLSWCWMLSVAVSAQVIHLTLAPAIMLAVLLAIQGEIAARHALPIAALFSLALPLWGLLVPLLQGATVVVNHALLWMTRIPARVDGSLIHLQAGTLHVANSCAGFNYLMAGLTLGAGYAFLFTDSRRIRLKIVLVAGAVCIVSNWLRVFGLVVVGHVSAMRSSLMQDHVLYGWLIFAASMPLVFHFAARIERADTGLSGEGSVSEATNVIAEPDEATEPAVHLRPRTARVVAATLLALTGPLSLFGLGAVQPKSSMSDVPPGVLNARQFTHIAPDSGTWSPAFKGEKAHRRSAAADGGIRVQLDHYLYSGGDDASEMIGSENRLVADSLMAGESVVGPLDDRLRMSREALVRTADGNGRLVWYWYSVAGAVTPSAARAKLLELWALFTRKSASELVVLSAPCVRGECREARNALYRLVSGRDLPDRTLSDTRSPS